MEIQLEKEEEEKRKQLDLKNDEVYRRRQK